MIFCLKKIKVYLFFILLTVGAGALVRFVTQNSMESFQNLSKPALTPPSSVFPIVWAILYCLMGISAALIYLSGSHRTTHALTLYAVQLAVNLLWTIFFFNLQAYWFSFFWLLLLLGLIVAMVCSFWKISKPAALLQLPYLFWVTFAGYLSLMIAIAN